MTDIKVLGTENGYQHLWEEASANNLNGMTSATWMNNKRFYTWSVLADPNTELLFTRIGANDPKFNLRAEPGFLMRQKGVMEHTFLSVLEMHGNYNPGTEAVLNLNSSLEGMELIFQDKEVTGIQLQLKDGTSMMLLVAKQPGENIKHEVKIKENTYTFEGNYKFFN